MLVLRVIYACCPGASDFSYSMPSIDDSNSTTTRLLTLLNVSATKAGKRKWNVVEDSAPAEKLNKRKSARFSEPSDVLEDEINPVVPEKAVVEHIDLDDTTEQVDSMWGFDLTW